MRTGTLVGAMAGAGILGGVAGAFVFLKFFADSLAPKVEAQRQAPAAEPQFSPEEEAALRKLPRRLEELAAAIETLHRERAGGSARPAGPAPGPAAPAAEPADANAIELNERTAIATLRNLASCQAQIQTSGKIDCDNDGIGEYGTFLEMTGSTGVRKGFTAGNPSSSDFTTQGTPVNPPILSPAMASVSAEGMVAKKGYFYMIFLPDTQSPASFVHETSGPALAGGTGRVGVDMSETTWCCYAWPIDAGKTGNRAFFVSQSGDVLQSANTRARHGGATVIDARSAFRGEGMTSMVAVGTAGRDGDVWKVTN
jgi:hypothetical protein